MPRANVDPDELDRFAEALNDFLENTQDSVNSLNSAFSALGETWQDQKRLAFEEQYNDLLKQLEAFAINSREQIPYLKMLAEKIRNYLAC